MPINWHSYFFKIFLLNYLKTKARKQKKKHQENSFFDKADEKIQAAKFRMVNELLYTRESANVTLNESQKTNYINGFNGQRKKWPIDPLDEIMKILRTKPNLNSLKIADVGCGSAILGSKLKNVWSYDKFFQSETVDIIQCDMASVII